MGEESLLGVLTDTKGFFLFSYLHPLGDGTQSLREGNGSLQTADLWPKKIQGS